VPEDAWNISAPPPTTFNGGGPPLPAYLPPQGLFFSYGNQFFASKKTEQKPRELRWFFCTKTNGTCFQLTGNGSCKPMDKGNPLSNSRICQGAAPGWFFCRKNQFFSLSKNWFFAGIQLTGNESKNQALSGISLIPRDHAHAMSEEDAK
jgi:hypothetical protein